MLIYLSSRMHKAKRALLGGLYLDSQKITNHILLTFKKHLS